MAEKRFIGRNKAAVMRTCPFEPLGGIDAYRGG